MAASRLRPMIVVVKIASPGKRCPPSLAQASSANATTTIVFPVSLSAPSNETITIHFATKDGTAIAGKNYEPASGTLTFPPGVTTQFITVTVMGATPGGDADDRFEVDLSSAVNAIIEDNEGEGDIFEVDASGCPNITVSPGTIPSARAGVPFSQTFTASGSSVPIQQFDLDGGALPPGLSLVSSTGLLTGTPIASGTFTFLIAAIDANDCFGDRSYTLTVGNAPPMITGFSPGSGRAASSVTITGARLAGATAVRFGSVAATFTINSPTQITATVPVGATSGPISVMTPEGSATSAASFSFLNSAPVVRDGAITTGKNTPFNGRLAAGDADGTPLTFQIIARHDPENGEVMITNAATGDFTYTPHKDFVGGDRFFFLVSDGKAESNLATITVTVSPQASPFITGAQVSGKNLLISGGNFDTGAVIVLNGVGQVTKNSAQNPSGSLTGKKVAKQIAPGQMVRLQVRNLDGTLSAEFLFVRPAG